MPNNDAAPADLSPIVMPSVPSYKKGDKVATRRAYGVALAKLGHGSKRVVALDGDTKNSTFSELFKKEFPDRYIECFIAEQNMVGVAIGCATRDRTVAFASTFAAFLSRAYDQIRMGAISQTNVNLVGSHCGVSIGEDGPSQMALEDLALFRAIPTCTVFYPSDGVSTENAVD
uniref:Transketolase n=1 Tax=Oryzias melastigma TaxID=30732 RepID=I1SRV2_ORYME|nr:transketolase [Oryzias melastigma]